MTKSPLKLEEIISIINKSHNPNLLIEGKDDMKVYRKIKQLIGCNIQLIVCDGRKMLLKVYESREKFKDKTALFIADKDMFVFEQDYQEYENVIWTNGYSIENDIYMASDIKHKLLDTDLQHFDKLIKTLSLWFSHEVNEYKNKRAFVVDIHSCEITKDFENIDHIYIEKRNIVPDHTISRIIEKNPEIYFRGKNLLEALSRCYNKRRDCENLNQSQIFDMAYAFCDWTKMSHLFETVRACLPK